MPKHFEVGAPMRQTTVNSDQTDAAFDLLAEKLAPMVAKLLEGEGKEPATNGSNGRKIPDDWDTLPDGDSPGGASTPADDYELPD